MKKLKMILPMMAFIFAIALSFAFVNTTADDYYTTGYIQLGTTWYEVDVDCNGGSFDCEVQIQGEPGVKHQVYAYESTETPLKNGTEGTIIIDDPR